MCLFNRMNDNLFVFLIDWLWIYLSNDLFIKEKLRTLFLNLF